MTLPPRRRPTLVAGTAVLLVTALVAACGGGSRGQSPESSPAASSGPAPDLPAENLVRAARDAFGAAPSVHVTGTVVKGDQSYQLDLRLKGAAGGTARILPSTSAPGSGPHPEVRVVRIGGVAWVSGNLGFWRGVSGDDAGARRLAGSCVRVAVDGGNFGEYVAFTQPATLVALLPDPASPATLQPPVPLGGRRAVAVVVDRTSTLSVSAEKPTYPLQLSGLSADGTVSRFLDFSGYGARVPLRTPTCAAGEPGSGGGPGGGGGSGSGGGPGGGGEPGSGDGPGSSTGS